MVRSAACALSILADADRQAGTCIPLLLPFRNALWQAAGVSHVGLTHSPRALIAPVVEPQFSAFAQLLAASLTCGISSEYQSSDLVAAPPMHQAGGRNA